MNMKKSILIKVFGDKNWAGGLYYAKNIAFILSQNKKIVNNYKIIVLTNTETNEMFTDPNIDIECIKTKHNRVFMYMELLKIIIQYNVRFIFPMDKGLNFLGVNSISWIPDFQHNYFPDFFTEEELDQRDIRYNKLFLQSNPLVLSSNDCKNDFYKFYGKKKAIYVVPFVSYIADYLKKIDEKLEKEVCEKYAVEPYKYIVIANQFWKHKNHKLVLESIQHIFRHNKHFDLKFIFTGRINLSDNSSLSNQINLLLQDDIISRKVAILGFVERLEQIVLLKNAAFIIQPSLFEGWGTVLEDAKVLDKTVLLSDIPVHREQMNKKCILFDPHNAEKLVELIECEYKKEHIDDVNKGINDMYVRAKQYSVGFEQLLNDFDKG